jgi:heme oxygenase
MSANPLVSQVSAHAILKVRTASDHAEVDAAFSRFDLADRVSYQAFLQSHAAALPAIERVLAAEPLLPPWRPRTEALRRDLRALGAVFPDATSACVATRVAEKYGLLYVLEGSRLGGRLLQARVGPGFPADYLGATHLQGEWHAFLEALDSRSAQEGPAWLEDLVLGARLGFNLFARSVQAVAASTNS